MNSFIIDLFKQFKDENVRYCHFKSNNNLEPALSGVDDLDLLVATGDVDKFNEILSRNGFRIAFDRGAPVTPYVYHYFGMDPKTGLLVHLHVYFKIVTGGSIFKNHAIRVEKMFLDEAQPNGPAGVYIPSSEADCILFILRKFIEQPSIVEHYLFLKDWKNINLELQWLIERSDREKISNLVTKWLPEIEVQFFNDCLDLMISKGTILKRARLGLKMRKFIHNTVVSEYKAEIIRFFQFFLAFIKNRLRLHRKNRYLFPGGQIIAFVGSEASGKSTLSKECASWLSERFDVSHIHLGKPKKNWRTVFIWYAIYIFSFFKSKLSSKSKNHDKSVEKEETSINNPHPIVAWLDSIDRKLAIKKYFRKLMQGGIVITDRYPSRYMDGPRIQANSGFYKYLRIKEEKNYESIPNPDLVFRAQAPLEVTLNRNSARDKPEPEAFVKERYKIARNINFKFSDIIIVDTTEPYEQSVLKVKNIIWKKSNS